MCKTLHIHVHLNRTDANKNMARFYQLALEPTLFGKPAVVCRWGRLGSSGRSKTEIVDSELEALDLLLKILRTKRARGYISSPPKPDTQF
jgi:predicted DNA-binding WGR domain protein